MHLADTAGWLGALVLVGAYAASSSGRMRASSRAYQAMNLVGSVGLGAVATEHHAWPSLALNAVWLLVAATALVRTALPTRSKRDHQQKGSKSCQPSRPLPTWH